MTSSAARRVAFSGATSALAALALTAAGAQASATAVARAHAAVHLAHHGHSARHRHRHHRPGPHITGGQTLSNRTVTTPHVPAGPCPNADLEPTAANLAQIDQAAMCLVNKQRVAHGLAPLAENANLEAAALRHNNDMIAGDYFDHVSPGGSTPFDRIRATGYIVAGAGYEIGENIATGSTGLDTPSEIVSAWMNSPGHRANILNGDYTETGLAASAAMPASVGSGLSGGTYTQDFGVIN